MVCHDSFADSHSVPIHQSKLQLLCQIVDTGNGDSLRLDADITRPGNVSVLHIEVDINWPLQISIP